MNARFVAAGLLTIAALSFASYFTALELDFHYQDDYRLIKTAMESPANYFFGNWSGRRGAGGFYRPLIVLSMAANFMAGGIDPFGYHLTNVIVHAFNACMVFLIAYFLLSSFPAALSSGLIFALLPMNAEAVNWVCCRTDLIAAAFILASFGLFAVNSRSGKSWALALSLMFFILSLGSKETALALPLIITAFELFNGRLKERIRAISLYFAVLVPYFALRYLSLGALFGGYPLEAKDVMVNPVLGSLKTFQLVFLPFRQESVPLYLALMSGILIACAAFGYVYIRRKSPGRFFYFALSWTALGLLPALPILPIGLDLKTSRLWYLSSVGIAWLISYVVFDALWKEGGRKKPAAILILAVFMLYSGFFLLKANQNWAEASNMVRSIRAGALEIMSREPEGSTFYFCNVPDNYKGCFVGMPFLEPPFYSGAHSAVRELPAGSARYYVYESGRFRQSSLKEIGDNRFLLLSDDYFSRRKFERFIKGFTEN